MLWCNVLQNILIYMIASKVAGTQDFLEAPSYTEVDPGADVLLKCRIAEKRGICSWQKNSKPVGMYHGKYEWVSARNIINGDCSIWVRNARLQIDDGRWQCQVTASNYYAQDALSSPVAQLVVREAPQIPQIVSNGSRVLSHSVFTVAAGVNSVFTCEVRYGNPPANIEWYLGNSRMKSLSQKNMSEMDRPQVWSARSTLELVANRSDHGQKLICRAIHPSYAFLHHRNTSVILSVTFVPTVYITEANSSRFSNLEEGASDLKIHCEAEGNPDPIITWTKDGEVIFTNRSRLIIIQVTRNDSGIYGCQATNSIGTSDIVTVEIDIKFAPRIKQTRPKTVLNANLNSHVSLECIAEGNPTPSYQWYHCPNTTAFFEDSYLISIESTLQLVNISYSERGQYFCVAYNHIGNQTRSHRSKKIIVNVLGPPMTLTTGPAHGWCGSIATIRAVIWSNPPPKTAIWFHGVTRLDVPIEIDRYNALEYEKVDDCYHYTLIIKDVRASDAGAFVLRVGNNRGFISQSIKFTVHGTLHVAPIIASTLVFAGFLALYLCLTVRERRSDRSEFKMDTDIYSRVHLRGNKQLLPYIISTHDVPCIFSKQRELSKNTLREKNCKINKSLHELTYENIIRSKSTMGYAHKKTIRKRRISS